MTIPHRWIAEDRQRLRLAYESGGFSACIEAFPALNDSQISGAIDRYCNRNPTPGRAAWTWSDIGRLRDVMAEGGIRAAYAAFPDRSLGSIRSAATRYCGHARQAE